MKVYTRRNGAKHIRLDSSQELTSSSGTDDKISNLPKEILCYILSFLPMEDVVVTTILSRSWRNILSCLTTLDFEYSRFPLTEYREEKFIDFINRVLDNHNTIVQKFRVVFGFHCYYTPCVNSWIQFAVSRRVQELEFVIPVCEEPTRDEEPARDSFPSCLFTCESLVVLKLNTINSILKLPITTKIYLPQLKVLHLKWVKFLDENLARKLFSSCPVLDDLNLRSCDFTKFKILDISTPSLTNLSIYGCTSLEDCELKVSAPSLLSFKYIGYGSHDFSLENLSSLVNVEINFLTAATIKGHRLSQLFRGLANAKALTLRISCIEHLFGCGDALRGLLPSFDNLKHLRLESNIDENHIQQIICLLECCPNLESLIIEIPRAKGSAYKYHFSTFDGSSPHNVDWKEYFLSKGWLLHCLADRLKTVEIRSMLGTVDELDFIRLFLENAIVLEKMFVSASSFLPELGQGFRTTLRRMISKIPVKSSRAKLSFSGL